MAGDSQCNGVPLTIWSGCGCRSMLNILGVVRGDSDGVPNRLQWSENSLGYVWNVEGHRVGHRRRRLEDWRALTPNDRSRSTGGSADRQSCFQRRQTCGMAMASACGSRRPAWMKTAASTSSGSASIDPQRGSDGMLVVEALSAPFWVPSSEGQGIAADGTHTHTDIDDDRSAMECSEMGPEN